jgi:hypothetical protein
MYSKFKEARNVKTKKDKEANEKLQRELNSNANIVLKMASARVRRPAQIKESTKKTVVVCNL